jgi:hypothetical protein
VTTIHRPAANATRVTGPTPRYRCGMAICAITFIDGSTAAVEGELQVVIDELHKVATRREHSFALLRDASGGTIAVRPEAVVHVRPAS